MAFRKHFEFFGHNFASRNARKSIKGSEDLYYSLKCKEVLIQKINSLD